MKRLTWLFALFCTLAHAQIPDSVARRRAADSLWRIANQDHQQMMDQLHITALRPGAGSNSVNYDESKANPYPDLPDPLTLDNGKKVTEARTWWKERRPQIVEAFDREVYGRVPAHTPKVTWEVVSQRNDTVGTFPVIVKKLIGHVDNSADPDITVNIDLTLTTPADARPAPVMLRFTFVWPPWMHFPPDTSWQPQLLARGWGYANLIPTSIQADNGAGLRAGIIGLCNRGGPRKPDDWGALRAWAWGASRALDYFETDPAVNAKEVGLEGHSRYGKATLVAMAYDPRFSVAYVSSSGEGGAKLHRRNDGELVENLTATGEFHWMAGNFLKYGGPLHWNDLPVDSHELIALCAPRPVFVSAGSRGDEWTDQRGMFMACVAAGPVYRLLGKKDLGTTEMPPVGTGLMDGDLTWRQHPAGHTDAPNWPYFLDFASRYWR